MVSHIKLEIKLVNIPPHTRSLRVHRIGVVSQRLVLRVVHTEQLVAETCCCDLSPSHFRLARKCENCEFSDFCENCDSCRGLVFSSFSVFCDFCDFNGFCENCEFCEKSQKSQGTVKLGTLVPTRVAILTIFAKIANFVKNR